MTAVAHNSDYSNVTREWLQDAIMRKDVELSQCRGENAALRRVCAIAERICAKLEHPTASVTIIDQTDLRAALDALKPE